VLKYMSVVIIDKPSALKAPHIVRYPPRREDAVSRYWAEGLTLSAHFSRR
jgi:hypothetical protein